MNRIRQPRSLVLLYALSALSMAGCGGGGAGHSDIDDKSDIDRDETVQVQVTSSPTERPVEVSVTGSETVKVNGRTPFSTEVRVHLECSSKGTCILGGVTFVPVVNDPAAGTLTLCLSALGKKQCSTGTIIVFVFL